MQENIEKIRQLLEILPESHDKKGTIDTIIIIASRIRKGL